MDIIPLTGHADRLGEGPVWDDGRGRLIWTDIESRTLRTIRPDGADFASWPMPDRVTAMGLTQSGRLILALARSVALYDPASGAVDTIAAFDFMPPQNRLNDGKVGPDGAFWVGSMDERPNREKVASLYRITAGGRVDTVFENEVHVSNGLAWTPDARTMFWVNTRGAWIDRFDFDAATGGLTNRTRIATPDDAIGRPDGGACDALGRYWSAGVSAGTLNCFSRNGELIEHIKLPVAAPTMPCFGGAGLTTLFLTSLSDGLSPERAAGHPHNGRLLALDVGVAGAAVARFKEA
ncbi:MAG: SMP-30/gluconolactonase/LRE family protein [Ancalomicrobiaceae bacterium]|nr:SMP-30/gluconolactonase/LRE family protein [Ancalomicrobiaceae bacterium]